LKRKQLETFIAPRRLSKAMVIHLEK